MVFSVSLGSRVQGKFGCYLDMGPGRKRRQRTTIYGTVIKSMPGALWRVHWECYNRVSDHRILKVAGGKSILSIEELHALDVDTHYLGGVEQLRQYSDSRRIESSNEFLNVSSQPTQLTIPPASTVMPPRRPESPNEILGHYENAQRIIKEVAEAAQRVANPQQTANIACDTNTQEEYTTDATIVRNTDDSNNDNVNVNATRSRTQPSTATTPISMTVETIYEDSNDADADDINSPEETDILNPAWIREEVENNTGDKHQRAWATYLLEKKELIDLKKMVQVGKAGNMVKWTVRDDVKKPQEKIPYHKDVGVKGFDFNDKSVCGDGTNKRINFLHLLKHLWPGIPKEQIARINTYIRVYNDTERKRSERIIPLISEQEFFKFFGIMLVARIEGIPGGNLWNNNGKTEGYKRLSNLEKDTMKQYRFRQLKRFIPYMWSDGSKKHEDPWWQIVRMQSEFNCSRRQNVLAHFLKVADETMSAFRPQTKKTGNLPHLSFIQRKPEDLGTELKTMACSLSKIMIYMEIQRSRTDTCGRKFQDLVKRVTTACCMRMVDDSWQREPMSDDVEVEEDVFVGDSWFGSIPTAVSLKKNMPDGKMSGCIVNIKTAHARYPKAFLEGTMKNWPGGTHLVMEGNIDGVKLYAVGYKYCKKKTMCFLFTEGSSSTEEGEPYRARWKDENGNNMYREVARPECCSKYFSVSNTIDVLNQQRQKELRLEKFWVTEDGYFRIICTTFGICVVDCWNAYVHHLPWNHRHKTCDLMTVANMMAKDLLENQEDDTVDLEHRSLCIGMGVQSARGPPLNLATSPSGNTTISSLTMESESGSAMRKLHIQLEVEKHRCVKTDFQHEAKRKRVNQRTQTESQAQRKRTGRYSCIDCKKFKGRKETRTLTYCPACPPPKKAKAYWLCSECEGGHRTRIHDGLSST